MDAFFSNRWFHIFLLFSLLLGAVAFSGSNSDIRKRLQYATFDSFNRLHPREKSNEVVIIDIDEESLKRLGQFPWPRTVMAQMVDKLRALGAKAIAFDIVFAEEDRTSPEKIAQHIPNQPGYSTLRDQLAMLPDHDEIFAKSIKRAGNVVTGFTRAKPEETLRAPAQNVMPTFLVPDKSLLFEDIFSVSGVVTNLPEFSDAAAGNGSFMATPDIDGIIRQVSLFVKFSPENEQAHLYPILGLEALRVGYDPQSRLLIKPKKNKKAFDPNYILSVSGRDVPVESDMKLWVYYRDITDDEYVPAWMLYKDIFQEDLSLKIKDKIAFVGTSAEGLRDIRSTPLDVFIPGVEVHVNVVEQILQEAHLKRPDLIIGLEALIIAGAGLAILILTPLINVIWLGFFSLIMIGGMFWVAWTSYVHVGLLLDPVYPSMSIFALFLLSSLLSYVRSEAQRRQVRDAFGLYISPHFMEELTKNPDKLKLGGEVRDLTVMFTDIRSFTAISEHLSPEELIRLMNDFLTPMSDLVMENRGTIDKYMGDAMMAFWNAPLDDPQHARNACLSALKMNEALVPINEEVAKKAREEGREAVLLQAGIGINTGPCSVGNMGSRQRFAYSALGDAVNLASRLEGQTKAYCVNILVGEETASKVRDLAFVELDLIKVKGKEVPVKIYALIGDENIKASEAFTKWMTAHQGMLAAYRIMDFDCAAQDLKLAKDLSEGKLDGYYDVFSKRIRHFLISPPDESWGGIYEAKAK